MTFGSACLRRLLTVLLCALCGCFPPAQGQLDEEKEPHFLTGKDRVNSMDFKGAIEAFEKALEINPHSASAHFELAWLFEQKLDPPDHAAAIYHYDRGLRLRPGYEKADLIRQRIFACKQEMAKGLAVLPGTPNLQRDWERMHAENLLLRRQLEAWQAYYAGRGAASPTNPASVNPAGSVVSTDPLPAAPRTDPVSSETANTGVSEGSAPAVSVPASRRPSATAAVKTHIVKTGETPLFIARKYGVTVSALLTANRGLDPRRMRVGQKVNVPAP